MRALPKALYCCFFRDVLQRRPTPSALSEASASGVPMSRVTSHLGPTPVFLTLALFVLEMTLGQVASVGI